mgnify:CR=1 FL=1
MLQGVLEMLYHVIGYKTINGKVFEILNEQVVLST